MRRGAVGHSTPVVVEALPLGVVAAVFGVSFGALATRLGTTPATSLLASALIFAPGSQLAALTVLEGGGAGWLAVVTGLAVNARHGLLAVAVGPLLGPRRLARAIAAHLVVEGSVVAALARPTPGRALHAFWVTGLVAFALHLLGTVVGVVLGASYLDIEALGLDGALPATFIGLLAPALRGRRAMLCALAGAGVAVLLLWVVPASVAVLAAACTGIVAALVRRTT